jgi:hypothetical protein
MQDWDIFIEIANLEATRTDIAVSINDPGKERRELIFRECGKHLKV